jgi:hypothetical protein
LEANGVPVGAVTRVGFLGEFSPNFLQDEVLFFQVGELLLRNGDNSLGESEVVPAFDLLLGLPEAVEELVKAALLFFLLFFRESCFEVDVGLVEGELLEEEFEHCFYAQLFALLLNFLVALDGLFVDFVPGVILALLVGR